MDNKPLEGGAFRAFQNMAFPPLSTPRTRLSLRRRSPTVPLPTLLIRVSPLSSHIPSGRLDFTLSSVFVRSRQELDDIQVENGYKR